MISNSLMRATQCILKVILLTALLVSCGGEQSPQTPGTAGAVADLVFRNGMVYTVNPQRDIAQAVAVGGGRILAVGPDEQINNYIGPETRIFELDGRMLLPGFQDAHNHAAQAGWMFIHCALHDLPGLDAVLARIADCAETQNGSEWVTGEGWELTLFQPDGVLDRKLLDAVISDRPVAMWSYDAHSIWVNTRALEVAGIDAATPDPYGGRIDRDPLTGEATGGLHENASDLIRAVLPAVTDKELVEGLRYAQKYLNALGITAVQDPRVEIAGGSEYRVLPAYRLMADSGELTMRVRAALFWEPGPGIPEQIAVYERLRDQYSDGLLTAGAIKVYQDSIIETSLAALLEPYLGIEGDYRGPPLHDPEYLSAVAVAADAAGFQLHFHAIGDRAIRDSLDALETARRINGPGDSRHQVAHLELIDAADIPRFAELDVTANFQPLWAINEAYITELTVPKIGPERARWLYPIGSVLRSGGRVAFGSDWSVTSPNPLEGIETAVTRVDSISNEGIPLNLQEAISLEEAIAAYTINAAFVNFLDETTGSIEVGKLADLAVLDRDLFAIPASEISEARVVATFLEGKQVFESQQRNSD